MADADGSVLSILIDTGQGLTEQQYLSLLESVVADANAVQQQAQQHGQAQPLLLAVNLGAHPPRVVVLAAQAAAPLVGERGLIEEHLIAVNNADPQRRGVIVVVAEALQAHKKRRGGGLPDGVAYSGKGWGGRWGIAQAGAGACAVVTAITPWGLSRAQPH